MTALILVVLLGCAALAIDVGRVVLAAQIAQNAADAGALAGAPLLRDPSVAIAAAQSAVTANNEGKGAYAVTCTYTAGSTTSDIIYYPPGSTVPGYGLLGPYAKALRVNCRLTVAYSFGRALGLTTTQVARQALVVRGPVGGSPIAPLWVSHPTPYRYGEYQNLLMADGPHYADIPGNFGWLAIPSTVSVSWETVLRGDMLSEADLEQLFTNVGDTVWGSTGLSVGQWVDALNMRITRGSTGTYAGDTFWNFHPGNPRIILVPLVDFISGTGANAEFRVVKFGAFWIDVVKGSANPKQIDGRFIQYNLPGVGLDPLSDDTGLFTYRLAG